MYFKYGTYLHAQNEVQLQVVKQGLQSARGLKSIVRVTFTLKGILHSSDNTIPTLTTQLNALENAYGYNPVTGNVTGAADFRDAVLLQDDQATATSHAMYNGQSLSGVRVTGFVYDPGKDAEYTTYRGYTITLSGDFADTTQNLLDFQETLKIKGTGGPRLIWMESLEDPPEPQISAFFTTMKGSQSGSAVGAFDYIIPPDPIYPGLEHLEEREVTIGPVKRVGQSLYEFHTSWSYSFEGPGLPGARPNTP